MNFEAATNLPYFRQRHVLRGAIGPDFARRKTRTASDEKLGVDSGTQIGEVIYALVSEPSLPPHGVLFYGTTYGTTARSGVEHDMISPRRYVSTVAATSNSPAIEELTTTGVVARAIRRSLDALIDRSQDEQFEDGIDSDLSVGIRLLVTNYGDDFAKVLESRIKEHEIDASILSEILHTLGSISDTTTRDWRFTTLVEFLKHGSANVRDAAAVGLAYLDDKRADPFLREAIARESSESFKQDLQAILEQLGA